MLYRVSCILTRMLLERVQENKCDDDVYVYGIELIISTIVNLSAIMLISWLLSDAAFGFLFIAIFVPLRLFTGGYHATTYAGCFIITNLTYLILFIIKKTLWGFIPVTGWLGILVIAGCYIIRKAPIINIAQPINEYRQKRSKQISRYIMLVDLLLAIYFAFCNKELVSTISLSVCLVSAFMLITNKSILKRKESSI
ncbi:hypothetical protein ADH76_01380 [Enterocloster clostridioformis]|nr:hypothetical protein A4V08_03030 [Lachnoclostridium sp. YL32]NDO27678.1 hypothetical protein [Enterocloster clostridioformis]OXE70142.1 hypothetical protein ADH76_01380 [Enterocloster clostridioformis]QQR00285.1 accessory gene regulator B family protein [Enterocloster clostridioformis]